METLPQAITNLLERPEEERAIGHFVLVEKLGAGGFAPVWLARETYGKTVFRTAAVKLFSIEVGAESKSRILEEARALCRVEHPNVVKFYSLVVDEGRGVMGLAMEHIAGRSLEDRLEDERTLSVDEGLRVGTAIASALAAAHGKGVVHRDVKPSNIVEEAGGAYKLIDFGIASATAGDGDDVVLGAEDADAEQFAVTERRAGGGISGTPGYIDPACWGEGRKPTAASDLYALGAMIYRCLAGVLPAERDNGRLDGAVMAGLSAPISLATRAPGVPKKLAELVDSLLSPKPEQRPLRASWVAHRLEELRRDRTNRRRALPNEEEGPFRGLRRFEAADRDVFLGRTSEVAAAIEILRGRGLVALVGPSGSGKSSLARAGLLPALAEGALAGFPSAWDTVIVEPGHDPWAAMTRALSEFVPDAPELRPDELALALAERASVDDRGIVLLVDQLEELVTTSSPESRDAAAALLVRIGAQATPGVRAVVSARRDLLDPILALGDLGKTIARGGICLVEPLTPHDWRNIVEIALESYGYELEDKDLAAQIFKDIDATADAMPLVEFALTELWQARDVKNKRLTHAALEKLGGIAGALERHAERTLAAMEEARRGSMFVTRQVLLSLTTPEGTRARLRVDKLVEIAGEPAHGVIEALSAARLVVPSEGSVTLAHEALLTRWHRLAAWIAEAREERLLAQEIERDAEKWSSDPDSALLWRGRRLAFGDELVQLNTVRLSPTALEFVRASRRAERRGRVIAASLGAIVLFPIVLATGAYVRSEQRNALRERQYNERINAILAQEADAKSIIEQLKSVQRPDASPRAEKPSLPPPTPTPAAVVSAIPPKTVSAPSPGPASAPAAAPARASASVPVTAPASAAVPAVSATPKSEPSNAGADDLTGWPEEKAKPSASSAAEGAH